MPARVEQSPVSRERHVDAALLIELADRLLATGCAHSSASFGVDGQLGDRLCERTRIAWRDEEPGNSGFDDLTAASDVGCDYREAHGSRLHRRPGKALAVRGEHVQVHAPIQAHDVVSAAEEPHSSGASGLTVIADSASRTCAVPPARSRRSGTRGVMAADVARHRRPPAALLTHQPSDGTDDDVHRSNGSELDACRRLVGRGNCCRIKSFEVDPVPE